MKYNIFFFIVFVWVFLPFTTQAGEFVNLVGIPGLTGDPTAGGLGGYINALYRLSISIAALLAVIKIVAAGAKYMLSDIITHKEDAKKDIQGALIGLLIVIGAIVILNTINTDLTNVDFNMATTTIRQGPTIQDVIAQRIQQLNNAQASCASTRTAYEECATLDDVPGDFCRARNGQFTLGSLISTATGNGTCVFKQMIPVTGSNIINCSCTDRRTGWAEDGSWFVNFLDCYAYNCSEAASSCRATGNTVTSQNTNTGQVLCSQPSTQQGNINNSVGTVVSSSSVTSNRTVPVSSLSSALGMSIGDLGNTELELIASYLEKSLTQDQLEAVLGTSVSNISTLNNLSTQLNCGGSSTGDTVGFSRNGDNVVFQCVNAMP